MKWLEIIELRTSGKNRAQVEQELSVLIAGATASKDSGTVATYLNHTVGTDWSIHLCNESEPGLIEESPLGLRMAEALREFGLVHHSVWIKKKTATLLSKTVKNEKINYRYEADRLRYARSALQSGK